MPFRAHLSRIPRPRREQSLHHPFTKKRKSHSGPFPHGRTRPTKRSDQMKGRENITTIERRRIATSHSSWIEESTEKRIHGNRWTEPKIRTPAADDESPPTEKKSGISKQRTQPISLTRQRKERRGFAPGTASNKAWANYSKQEKGIRTGNSQNQILSLRARKKGRSFLDRGWGRSEVFTEIGMNKPIP